MTEACQTEAERVAEALRSEIVARKRLPGTRLIERSIAAELGVSRLPVRDALRVLEREGLVARMGRSLAVRELGLRDRGELTEVCEAFDAVAVRLAAESRTDEEIRGIEDSLEALSGSGGAEDALRYRRAVAEASHNEFVVEISTLLRGREAGEVLAPALLAEHGRGVVAALKQHDADAAEAAVRTQYRATREAFRHEVISELESRLADVRAAEVVE